VPTPDLYILSDTGEQAANRPVPVLARPCLGGAVSRGIGRRGCSGCDDGTALLPSEPFPILPAGGCDRISWTNTSTAASGNVSATFTLGFKSNTGSGGQCPERAVPAGSNDRSDRLVSYSCRRACRSRLDYQNVELALGMLWSLIRDLIKVVFAHSLHP
jgi:hypothetical protein